MKIRAEKKKYPTEKFIHYADLLPKENSDILLKDCGNVSVKQFLNAYTTREAPEENGL